MVLGLMVRIRRVGPLRPKPEKPYCSRPPDRALFHILLVRRLADDDGG